MIRILLAAVLLTTAAPMQASSNTSPPLLKTSPCRIGQAQAAAICGTLTVFENRPTATGRTIDIHFIVIQAKHPATHRAIAYNPGGPGASATAQASDLAGATGAMATLRDNYDLLFVDNRGTGKSAKQSCNFAPADHPELYFRQLWPDSLVRACRDRLAAQANLSLYSTSLAADDLNDVRAALGYPRLVLFGGSYGTLFYLDYARRHPASVESIVLEGVAPPHFYVIPLPMARGAQTAIKTSSELAVATQAATRTSLISRNGSLPSSSASMPAPSRFPSRIRPHTVRRPCSFRRKSSRRPSAMPCTSHRLRPTFP